MLSCNKIINKVLISKVFKNSKFRAIFPVRQQSYSSFREAREKNTIDPNWVRGFIDGEGSFIIAILPSTSPNKKKVSLRLSVTQKSHSMGVLYDLRNFFGCGQVITSSRDCMRFVVQSKYDIIEKIIPHFIKYPLVTSKQLNFET